MSISEKTIEQEDTTGKRQFWSILSRLVERNHPNYTFEWCASRIGSWSTTISNLYPLGQIIKHHMDLIIIHKIIFQTNPIQFFQTGRTVIRNYVLNQIVQLAKSCFLHLRNIVRISPSLYHKDAETIIQSFIISRLGFCNSLFSGLPAKFLNHLQLVQ